MKERCGAPLLGLAKSIYYLFLRKIKKTKVRFILKCKMQRTNLATGETIENDAAFSLEIEENLEGTDKNK